MVEERQTGKEIDLAGLLAYIYAPLLPFLKRVKVRRVGSRGHNPRDILLPAGYAAELVATGLNTPVQCCFDEQGACYVVESGHLVDARPRIVKLDVQTGEYSTYFEWPRERWIETGAVTGAVWHQGALYVSNTDTLSRIWPDGRLEDVVTGLPGLGDHQTNSPLVGPDGKLYFGVGSATNAGVVGADNFGFEWLQRFPHVHDVPARDVTLAGRNYEDRNVLGNVMETVRTGAYVPFGTATRTGQVIKGASKSTGAILRCNPDGSELEVFAWGLRDPCGLAFHADGRLIATEQGIDERGRRFIVGDPDDLYEIRQGAWYGWPDFAAGIRLDDPHWGTGGRGRDPVLAEHPDPGPPRPLVTFEPHSGASGLAFSADPGFGFVGDAFVAMFGDLAPVTTHHQAAPAGFKVVRVDLRRRQVVDFATNRISGPQSKLPHLGFERPAHCAFGPDGSLYVVDWGEIRIAPERAGVRMRAGTGALWRIRRTAEPAGERPPRPLVVPLYTLQYLGIIAGVVGLAAAGAWLARRLGSGRTH